MVTGAAESPSAGAALVRSWRSWRDIFRTFLPDFLISLPYISLQWMSGSNKNCLILFFMMCVILQCKVRVSVFAPVPPDIQNWVRLSQIIQTTMSWDPSCSIWHWTNNDGVFMTLYINSQDLLTSTWVYFVKPTWKPGVVFPVIVICKKKQFKEKIQHVCDWWLRFKQL